MTDIVERLRDRAASYDDRAGALELEAVDEIERLRALITSHHEFFEGAKANLDQARHLIVTLRAELREAGLLR